MDPDLLALAGAYASIAALIGQYLAERRYRADRSEQAFRDWLVGARHEELRHLISQDLRTSASIKMILHARAEQTTQILSSQHSELLESVTWLSQTDSLTGVYTRRQLQDQLQREIDSIRPLALMMADVDGIKEINQGYGYLTGDEIIQCFAQFLLRSARPDFLVARMGGDRFAIVLPQTQLAEALHLAQVMAASCAASEMVTRMARLRITAGFGVAAIISGTSRDVLEQNADTALYRAKRRGRNQVFSFDPTTEIRL